MRELPASAAGHLPSTSGRLPQPQPLRREQQRAGIPPRSSRLQAARAFGGSYDQESDGDQGLMAEFERVARPERAQAAAQHLNLIWSVDQVGGLEGLGSRAEALGFR